MPEIQPDDTLVGCADWIPNPTVTGLEIDDLRPAHLRAAWVPRFRWVGSVAEAADRINLPHEDYPIRVADTLATIESVQPMLSSALMVGGLTVSANLLHRIHRQVFGDMPFAGRWRDVGVRVGLHLPPAPDRVPHLMDELERETGMIDSLPSLWTWYFRMETAHPYQDGNGRAGGIVVAALSAILTGGPAWLAPLTFAEEQGRMDDTPLWGWEMGRD